MAAPKKTARAKRLSADFHSEEASLQLSSSPEGKIAMTQQYVSTTRDSPVKPLVQESPPSEKKTMQRTKSSKLPNVPSRKD